MTLLSLSLSLSESHKGARRAGIRVSRDPRIIASSHHRTIARSHQRGFTRGCTGRRRVRPAFSPNLADATGLERRARPQKCKYRLANQSDWSHSLECPSFTNVIYRCRKARDGTLYVPESSHCPQRCIGGARVRAYERTSVRAYAGCFEKGIASFSGSDSKARIN
jgi:hypothetical protein